jgi:hypothetical protein
MENGSSNVWDAKTFSHYALCDEFTTFIDSEKVVKSMPKWLPKVIVDAERDRRTLGEPANQGVRFRGGTVS